MDRAAFADLKVTTVPIVSEPSSSSSVDVFDGDSESDVDMEDPK